MADVNHSTLTEPYLHEPKGASSATANEVYVFNGAGSGTPSKITKDSIDSTSVLNVNKAILTTSIDVSALGLKTFKLPRNASISYASVVWTTPCAGVEEATVLVKIDTITKATFTVIGAVSSDESFPSVTNGTLVSVEVSATTVATPNVVDLLFEVTYE